MFVNVRIDGSFLDEPYKQELKHLQHWLDKAKDKKVLLLELGAGYNTPGVIRMPMERIKASFNNASFIRVNMEYAEIPPQIKKNSLSVKGNISSFIEELHNA